MSALMAREIKLIEEFRDLSLVCRATPNSLKLGMLKVTNNVLEEIKEGQRTDPELVKQLELINQGRGVDFKVDKDRITRFHIRLLEKFSTGFRNPVEIEFCISPADRWTD
jgi:hypothetical protein